MHDNAGGYCTGKNKPEKRNKVSPFEASFRGKSSLKIRRMDARVGVHDSYLKLDFPENETSDEQISSRTFDLSFLVG